MSKHTRQGQQRKSQQEQQMNAMKFEMQFGIASLKTENKQKALDAALNTLKDSENNFSESDVLKLANQYYDFLTQGTLIDAKKEAIIQKLAANKNGQIPEA